MEGLLLGADVESNVMGTSARAELAIQQEMESGILCTMVVPS